MTLEDFFTLTEMNNGLAAPSRVKELVAVMQKESDCILTNIGEATRQWHTVASAIAATENQECLDLLIQLDALQFIAKWLKDGQKFGNDSIDDSVEDSITHLLQALGKLHVDYEKLVASEMWATVKDLLVHRSSKVQHKAQVLYDSWKEKKDCNASLSNIERFGAVTDDEVGKSAVIGRGSGHPESSQRHDPLSGKISGKEEGQESTRDDPVQSASSDGAHAGQVESRHNLDKELNPSVGENGPSDHVGSASIAKPVPELPFCVSVGATSTKSCNPAVSRQGGMDFHELELASDVKHAQKIENSPEKIETLEKLNTSEGKLFPLSSGAADAIKSVTEPSPPKTSVVGYKNLCSKGSACVDSSAIDSDGKGSMEIRFCANQCRSSSAADEGGELKGHKLCKSSSVGRSRENTKELGAFLSGTEDNGKTNKPDLHTSDDKLANSFEFAKKIKGRETDRAGKKSDVELYGIVDPLEVALQVAIEVERELVYYREQSGSASEKQAEGNVQRPDSPESVSGKLSHASESSSKDVAGSPDLSAGASPMQEESSTSTENLYAAQTSGTHNMACQVTGVTQEEDNTEKDVCSFDLNQVILEDADHPGNQLFTPVSIVSASRAAAAPGLPVLPLQFEGNLGWKGTAATSAFRPASPCRMPESEKYLYAGENISSSKQRQGFLDIDLNVAEGADSRTENLSLDKNVPSYSSLTSGKSYVDTKRRKFEHLELDLNHTSEYGTRSSDWQMGQFFPEGNDHNSQSHSSSSKLPSLKNIDLNDQPSFLNDSSDNSYLRKLSQNLNVSGVLKSDDSVISIMGTGVVINRKDRVSQTLGLPNGWTLEHALDVNSGRGGSFLGLGSALPHAHSSVYGYNNIASGPIMPFSSNMYGSGGPIPYTVDSRGAPVIPQIVGSASAMAAGFSQTPFFMSISNQNPFNGDGAVGPSQSNFDLNSGTRREGGSRDPAGLAQFLNLGQVRSVEEQLRCNSQPTIRSVVGGKRKEPDNGWENHYTPPWK